MMKECGMIKLSSRLTEMGIPHSSGFSNGTGWIEAEIKGIDLSVCAEIDDDEDDDMVVFSLRKSGELMLSRTDKVADFPAHLETFMRALEQFRSNGFH